MSHLRLRLLRLGEPLFSSCGKPAFSSREAAVCFGCLTAYVLAFFVCCTESPASIWWLTSVPAITAGWSWGLRRGFVVGVAMSPLNALLFACVGLPGWGLISAMPGVWAHALAPLAGAVFGRLHDLNLAVQKVRDEARTNQRDLQLTRRSLDATLHLLSEQAQQAHHSLAAQGRAEAENRRSQQELARTKICLTRSSLTDLRTDLPNRRAARDFLRHQWIAAQQRNRPLSCLVVAIDDLAPIRALHGLESADQVVCETAEILRDSIRETDRLFALGDEEFLIVGPNLDASNAQECAERLRALVEVNTVIIRQTTHHVSISLGVACTTHAVGSEDDLLRTAQQALFAAQFQGQNCVVCCEAAPAERRPLRLASALGQ
ncbi:MAG TPA: GGDEF domain-containing protein [Pirellulales bacterium]|jgi:diguanylate cyclase (GGDEF)-like protein|nr:GGDEF domain-containing protein [Pirellulales bacterium]